MADGAIRERSNGPAFPAPVKRRDMKAAKPARRFSRKPIARTVGSETGLFRQRGFRTARRAMVPE
jgi:hypothetical protein